MSEERRRPRGVVAGGQKKETGIDRFNQSMDLTPMPDVFDHMIYGVIIPWVKDFFANAASEFIDFFLYKKTGRSSFRGGRGYVPTNYSNISRNNEQYDSRIPVRSMGQTNNYRTQNFSHLCRADGSPFTLADYEKIVAELTECIRDYRTARVADLYYACEMSSMPSQIDNDWGWDDCRAFHYRRLPGGFIQLDFDPPHWLRK